MAVYNIAGIPVEYDCTYELLKSRSEKYKAPDGTVPEFTLKVADETMKRYEKRFSATGEDAFEYMGMGSLFYKKLLSYEGMMLHASAVMLDGYAYLFSAPCGTGKSTHTEMWQKLFGSDRAVIINDDKPAIRKVNGIYHAFGTPFSGKNDISVNAGYPVKGICFIHRAKENRIRSINAEAAITPFFDQTLRPADESLMDLLCERIDDILNCVSFYILECRADVEAAQTAYDFMKGGVGNEDKA